MTRIKSCLCVFAGGIAACPECLYHIILFYYKIILFYDWGVVGNVDRIIMRENGTACQVTCVAVWRHLRSGIAAACADARTRVLSVLLIFYL